MAAISQTINNVLGGVSQQPDPVKLPGQVRVAENAYLDPTFGCTKRPGTQFIKKIGGSDIPNAAQWFSIFRSEDERYIGCIYNDALKVWNADTGDEATIAFEDGALNYLKPKNLNKIRTLTVNDYTFILNGEKKVVLNKVEDDTVKPTALVVINQVAYNTTYGIDFLRDGDNLNQVKVLKATRLSVTPNDWEVIEEDEEDQGSCAFAYTESFVKNNGDDKTGLGFTLSTTCNPTLVTDKVPGNYFPTKADKPAGKPPGADLGFNPFFVNEFGYAEDYQKGSYLYKDLTVEFSGDATIDVRVEARVEEWPTKEGRDKGWQIFEYSRTEILSYNARDNYPWKVGKKQNIINTVDNGFKIHADHPRQPNNTTVGITIEIAEVRRGEESIEYSYKSAYRTVVSLNNGGRGWPIGESVSVDMNGKTYIVKVEDNTFDYSYESEAAVSYTSSADTSSGPLDVGTITSNLVSEINGLAGYSATPVGNVIVIEKTDGRDFNLQTRGGTANSAMYGLKDSVNDISQLPAQCKANIILKVSNSDQSDADDYYVKFTTEGSIPGQGSWIECAKPGESVNFDPGTMPHVLERDSSGQFSFKLLTKENDPNNYWQPRDAGDGKTNPAPTFVDRSITDMVFYQNRLGFISGESIILSQAGDYFNFFQGSAIAISDADPIDMSVSSTKPAALKASVGTPSGLLLFAQNSQFLLKSEDVAFGPSTARIDEITSFSYRSAIPPMETGISVIFPTSADTFSKVYELSIDSLNSRPLVSENTRIVPEFVPPRLRWGATASNNGLVCMGEGDEDVYIFKFYNTGNERNLAGWTKWVFNGAVRHGFFDHDTGYFVIRNDDNEHIIAKMELMDDPETSPIVAFNQSFTPRLDHYMYENDLTVTTTEGSDFMRVDLPAGFYMGEGDIFVIATSQGTETFYSRVPLENDDTGDFITIRDSLEETGFIVGLGYNLKVQLPSFFVKEGEQNLADRRNPPMVENAYLDVYFSGRYELEIQKLGYITRTVDLDVVDADIYLANSAAMENFATKEIPVFSRGDLVTLTINAPDPLPASLTSYSWEGHYSTRGIARR